MAEESYKEWIDKREENFPYYSPAPNPGDFPIVASTIVYQAGTGTEYSLEEFTRPKEAGFNVMGVGAIGSGLFKANLLTAREAGVRLSIWNNVFTQAPLNEISFLTSESKGSLGIFSFADEPSYLELIGKEEPTYDNEGNPKPNFQEKYRYLMSQKDVWAPVLINLFGGPENKVLEGNLGKEIPWEPEAKEYEPLNDEEIKWNKFENYVEKFQDYFKPSVFCYDLYPIREYVNLIYAGFGTPSRGKQEGTLEIAYDSFYKDLELFADISKRHKRPFWTFVESMCMMHSSINDYFRPVQLEQYFRFVVFNALAYGAKAILYWTYGMRENNGTEKYFSALLNRRNEETASLYFAKKVNEEIHQYEDIFVGSSVDTTYKCKGVEISASRIANMVVIGESEIVSSLIYKGNDTYLMIVNTDALNYQSVKIDVGLGRIIELTPLTSEGERNVQLEIGKTERILPPGGYRIFKLTNLIITGNPIEEGQYIYPILK